MSKGIEIRLPEEVLQAMPADRAGQARYLAKHFQGTLADFEKRFCARTNGGPLIGPEKDILLDFLIEMALPEDLRKNLDGSAQPT